MKNNSVVTVIERVSQWLFAALLILIPLLVIPYTRNLIVDTKTFLVFVVTLLILLGFAIKTLIEKKWEVAVSPLTLPLFLFGVAVALSTFLGNKYPVEALLSTGGIFLGVVLMGMFGASLVKGDLTKTVIKILGIAGALLSASMILQSFGWGPTRLINSISAFNLPHDLQFNLSGSSFVAIQVLLVALVGLIADTLSKKKVTVMNAVLAVIIAAGLGLGVWSILPGKIAAVSLTPLTASWTVMARSLESPQRALIGYGPASYANSYAKFKPLWTNGQAYWQFNFGTATDTPLTLIVTLGILGVAAWLFLVVQTALQLKHSTKESKPLLWVLLSTFLIQLLLPANIVILALQIPLLVFWVAANQDRFSLLQFKSVKVRAYPAKLEFIKRLAGKGAGWFVRVTALAVIIIVFGLGYCLSRAYAAYYNMYQANKALAAKNAVQVYDNERQAVQANPYLDSLRREYALTNLQLAIALANNANITDDEKKQVVQLISQSIREGKAATLLDADDVDNWLALAEVYRNLIGAAKEANTWSVNSLVSAVQVNPINPVIRLQIGQLMLSNNNAQDAVKYFAQAVQLKPDLAAGYYQLGLGFRALNQLDNTRTAWQKALSLLPTDSQDYTTLSGELKALGTAAGSAAPVKDIAPSITEQNVQQQESDIVKPANDASLTQ